MKDLKIPLTLIFAMVLQFIALVWYVSKIDSKVNILYSTFEEENQKDVIENQVKMKLDLENLMQDVKQIKKDLRQGNKKDKEIMDQHKQLFNLLNNSTDMMQQSETKGGSYSYGD
jgi:flagellar biosynthesis/type III secretory pathway chaperone